MLGQWSGNGAASTRRSPARALSVLSRDPAYLSGGRGLQSYKGGYVSRIVLPVRRHEVGTNLRRPVRSYGMGGIPEDHVVGVYRLAGDEPVELGGRLLGVDRRAHAVVDLGVVVPQDPHVASAPRGAIAIARSWHQRIAL